jgi:DnaJ-class molecular chaperone
MRAFEEKNYYEILDLPPSAGLAEIERAYTDAIAMYDEDALATYALFTDEQRNDLLQTIHDAYQTLSNVEKRTDYNQMLISTGQVDAAMFSEPPRDSSKERREDQLSSEPGEQADTTGQNSKEDRFREIMETIAEKGLVSGENLRQLRETRGIDITAIFQRTRISRSTLGNIEQNRYEDLPADIFLRSFLKSYAEILGIDPECIIDGYLKHRELWPGGKNYILNLQPDKS